MIDSASPPIAAQIDRSIVAGQARGVGARHLRDAAARWVVWIGGLGVIGALLLIFVYLLTEVAPLFAGASLAPRAEFALPADGGRTLFVAAEEQGEVGMRLAESG